MGPKYQKLLVTTDLSPNGNTAVPHAYAILEGRSGTVILCFVVNWEGAPDPLYAQPMPEQPLAEQQKAIRESLCSSLETLVPKEVCTEGKVATEVRVVEASGPVHEVICEEAAALDVDLIVMASHGYSGVKRLLLGSVAEGVLRSAGRPILMVRSVE